jgi:hypothetical protein
MASAGKDVAVFLKTSAILSAPVLADAQSELSSQMRTIGVRIIWWNPGQGQPQPAVSRLIIADFNGVCSSLSASPDEAFAASNLPPLASTSVSDGIILPFAHVDCSALEQLVGPVLAAQPVSRREHLFGRAIGRLLAHEVYHIVAQTADHAQAGIAKEHFSTKDLLAEHFDFDPATIARAASPARLSTSPQVHLAP